MNNANDSGKSYYDLAMNLSKDANGQVSEKIMNQNYQKILVLMHKSAELNYHDAQEGLFILYAKTNPREAQKWFYRAERSKQGLPNSPETDYKPSVIRGDGCAGVIVIGILTVASLYFI